MKLIDLLVQHLGSNGGWPIGAEICAQDNDGEVCFYANSYIRRGRSNLSWSIPELGENKVVKRRIFMKQAEDMAESIITREQYEAAIAASKQLEWNGEGMPPVGCECEAFDGISWYPAVVVSHYDGFAFAWNYDHRITFTVNEIDSRNFRPIRTEAEQRREDTKNAIAELCRASASNGHSADLIYDAIAAGKIPGIKLAD